MSDEHDPVVTESVLKSELTILRSELKSELTVLRSQLIDRLEKRISEESATTRARISEEGATTRAHFDIMVERMDGTVRLVAEVAAHHGIVLDNHEARLQKIEKRSI